MPPAHSIPPGWCKSTRQGFKKHERARIGPPGRRRQEPRCQAGNLATCQCRLVVADVVVGARLFLLPVFGGAPLVNAWAVVGGVAAESDIQIVQEQVHSCTRSVSVCAWRQGSAIAAGNLPVSGRDDFMCKRVVRA